MLVTRITATAERAQAVAGPESVVSVGQRYAADLLAMTSRLVEVSGSVGGVTASDPEGGARVMAEATAYLEAMGHLVIAWLWVEQWLVAREGDDALHAGKRAAAEYFMTRELPKVAHLLDLVAAHDGLTTALDPDVL